MTRHHALTLLVVMWFVAVSATSWSQSDPFTVKDSIEMLHFNDPDGRTPTSSVWKTSPDGRTVLLVTTKGVVAMDMVESTLWSVDLQKIQTYLHEIKKHDRPLPKAIFSVRGQLQARQANSYGSLITEGRWSKDSKSIVILLEQQNGRHELDRIDVASGHKERLSENKDNVTAFSMDKRGVSYFASRKNNDMATVDVINTVRGKSFMSVFQPSHFSAESFLFRSDDSGTRLLAPASADSEFEEAVASPSGDKIVYLVPVVDTPTAWKQYHPGLPDRPLYRPNTSQVPVLQWDVVDLHTRSKRPLLSSPSGATAGYSDKNIVMFSTSGKHVVVTNTFLPLDGNSEAGTTENACAVAYVGVADGRATCIVSARSSKSELGENWAVDSLEFGQTERDVIVNFSWYGSRKTECYSLTGKRWSKGPDDDCKVAISNRVGLDRELVRLELVQNLNCPPSIWAEDVSSRVRTKIWDPNPHFATKESGIASVYHWQDSDKRQWSGGLILPQDYKQGVRYPLIVQTHGFNSNEFLDDGAWSTAMAARPLAAAGFVVLQVEDKHEQVMTPAEVQIHLKGYSAAIDELAASGVIDTQRIGIIGFSRTCWFVEEMLLKWPKRFAAAVIADGADQSYFQYMLVGPEWPELESQRYNGGKPVGEALNSWIKKAPDFRLSAMLTPLRLQAIGPASLIGEWEIYASLKIQGKPVDMLYLPRGQHVLQNPSELMASEQGDVDWFRFWLQGYERLNPEDPDQYKRWEGLRELRDANTRHPIITAP